jgi:hypothetical protein
MEDEGPRTTAMGLLTDAREMLAAAVILHNSGDLKVSGPTFYLLGHAIEVALKSFLLANGDSLQRLKLRVGHNLEKASRRVIATKCDPLAKLVSNNVQIISLLNINYQEKEFEYRVTGAKLYPPKDPLLKFLRQAIPIIEPLALRVYPGR